MAQFGLLLITVFGPILGAGLLRVFLDKYRFLPLPLDFGLHFRGKRLFGPNKTWGGFLILSLVAGILGLLLSSFTAWNQFLPSLYGFWLGFFYTLGELLNSFIKRQMEIPAGQNLSGHQAAGQYFLDQIDSVLGICLFLFFCKTPFIWVILVLGFLTHLAVDILNHSLGSKQTSDKTGLWAFWQLSFYLCLLPLKIFIPQSPKKVFSPAKDPDPKNRENLKNSLNKQIEGKKYKQGGQEKIGKIITANHPFFLDSLFLLISLEMGDFLQFLPLRYVVSGKFQTTFWYFPIWLTGGIFNQWQDFFQPQPAQEACLSLQKGCSLLIFYEGEQSRYKKPNKELKKGIFKISTLTQTPVYAFQILPIFGPACHVYFKGKIENEHISEAAFLENLNRTVYE